MYNIPEQYSADKPITKRQQDRFQRFNFSKRIAETIIQRNSDESIVFGLFGAWGEGKSSVINFIDGVLQKEEEIITIHLNPWRYTDEESLLYNFFERIAKALDKELNNKKEKAASLVEKYGRFSKFFGIDLADISKAIADTKLEEFKGRVDSFLSDSSQRLVIFIDDIDRLDKQEISVLFRLIKLTADFSNTVYVLSFDESMVAAAIGERFGKGDIKAGENFLEKIIQVPLTIPKAQPEALKKFCFDLLNNALDSNNIEINQDDANRFVHRFSSNLLNRLDTPRIAIRYSNTISFSLPLLQGEVNTVDLMLIEASKVFYPEYYKFIKDRPDFFIESYNSGSVYGESRTNQSKIEALKKQLEGLGSFLKKSEKEKIEELLAELFPKLKSALQNYHYGNDFYEKWHKEKRICSSDYFDRYFSYAVIEGDISDVEFDLFINDLSVAEYKSIKESVETFMTKTSAIKFIEKLHSKIDEIAWENGKNLCFVLTELADKYDSNGSLFSLGMDSSLKRAAIFIYRHLELHKDKEDLFETCIELLQRTPNIEFTSELIYWYNKGEQDEDKILSQKQFQTIYQTLVDKAFSMLEEDDNIFTKFPKENRRILRTWYSISKRSAKNYVSEFLKKKDKNVMDLLWAFTPYIRSSSHPTPYNGDLSMESFEQIADYVSHKRIRKLLVKLFGKKALEADSVIWDERRDDLNTDINLARQFIHRHDQNIKSNTTELADN